MNEDKVSQSAAPQPVRQSGNGSADPRKKAIIENRLLYIGTLFVAVVIVLMSFVTLQRIHDNARTELSHALETVLKTSSSLVHQWHTQIEKDIKILSQDAELVRLLSQFATLNGTGAENAQTAEAHERLYDFLHKAIAARGYIGFIVMDLDGRVVSASDEGHIGKFFPASRDPEFFIKLKNGVIDFALPQSNEAVNAANSFYNEFFLIGNRVLNAQRRPIAFLALIEDPMKTFSALLEVGQLGSTGETYAFDSKGLMVSRSQYDSQLQDMGLLKRGEQAFLNIRLKDPGANLLEGENAHLKPEHWPLGHVLTNALKFIAGSNVDGYRDYRGVPVVGAWEFQDDIGLGVVTEIDVEEAYASYETIRSVMLGGMGITLALLFVLSALFHWGRRRLQAQAERTRAVVDSVLDAIITIDEFGIVDSFNPAAEKLFRCKAADVIGHNINILMPEPYHSAHDGYLQNYLQTGDAKIIGIGREIEAKRMDGTVFYADLSVTNMMQGSQRMFLGMLRDITERKQAEENLRLSEENLKFAQQTANLGSWSWDIASGELRWTDEIYRIFGFFPQQFAPTYDAFLQAVHPEDRDAVSNAVSDSLSTRKPYNIEHRVVRPDGTVRYVHERGQAVYDEDGEAIRMDGIVHDITEHKEAERAKSQFVSTVSHELRTPLTSIHGSLGLIAAGAVGEVGEKMKQLLDVAYSSSDRLIRLINDILDFEKLDAGKMSFDFAQHVLSEMISQAVSVNQPYAEKYGVTLHLEPDLGSFPNYQSEKVWVDTDRFAQVMANLISNACKFSPKGGKVTIKVESLFRSVKISVIDKGPGIAKEFHDKIFSQFTQADSSDTRAKEGTGLGLSITKAIVEQMGGAVSFTTELGQGTTFYFTLPLRTEPLSQQRETREGPQVLVCEDDAGIAMVLDGILQQNGIHADIAYSATQAKTLLEANTYSAMTLDIVLPDQDGISLLREIRENEKTKHLPVVVVSSFGMDEQSGKIGNAIDIVDWLTKPIDPRRLNDAIIEALSDVKYESSRLKRVLHIEDNADARRLVADILQDAAEIIPAESIEKAEELLSSQVFDLIILDAAIGDQSGFEVLSSMQHSVDVMPKVLVFSAATIDDTFVKQVATVLNKGSMTEDELALTLKSLIK